jgi:hypothetical protein
MDFLQREFVLVSNLSSFYWKNRIDSDFEELVYMIDRELNVIKTFNTKTLKTKILVGTPYVYGY